jgi:hypothetical protein
MKQDPSADIASWALMDSAGNLIDSFDHEKTAREALQQIIEADSGNAAHVALIGFDDKGEPVASTSPTRGRVI